MSDPRPGKRFSLDETPPARGDPRPGQRFEDLDAGRPLDESAEPGRDEVGRAEAVLDAGLARPRKRRWGLLTLLGGALGLGALEGAQTLYRASLGGDWLAGGWSLLLLLALGLGGTALGRELWRLRRLRRHDRLREALEALPQAGPTEAQALAERLRHQLGLDDDHPHWRGYLAARAPHHDGAETAVLLAHHLLAPRDREARRLISRMSGDTAVMVALSPLTLVDMALVAWRNLALVDRLARLYGLELGYASRLRLLRAVLYNMAFAGASELASEAGMELVSMNLAGRISLRGAQGLGIGLLSARLGLRTQRLARPLAFAESEAPRLKDLRRDVWQRLRRLETQDAGDKTPGS
ncbi:TIGR01620 family protein [Halomonas sp. 328]|uniref:TIGR01620 family protein n=1 Tax=Halomonas sp. 328 TaxID=2776704 RepID=UPI0018A6FDD3|nr:TIGR01620 family protein [Halomonas sp. 328]MBF8222468.1 TIGR01620 family protein [Halomonas sp. 328]